LPRWRFPSQPFPWQRCDVASDFLRFTSKLSIQTRLADCWHWIASDSGNGYGKFYAEGRMVMAHRWIYEQIIGPIPPGFVLDHECRNRDCCNPWHLTPRSNLSNTLLGDGPTAQNFRKLFCRRGHPLVGGNVLRRRDRPGHRECRRCRRMRSIARGGNRSV
jgi:hypothetical protein